jgi:hypothetical protein
MVAEQAGDAGRPSDAHQHDDIDPRYDPAFQRGYQPKPGERPVTRVRPESPDAPYRRPSALLRTQEPADEYEYAVRDDAPPLLIDPQEAFTADPSTVLDSLASSQPAVVVAGPGILDRLELDPRRNPLMLALWIVGGGFVVLGIVLYCISVSTSYTGPTPSTDVGQLVFAQLGWMLAGPLITVGLLTLVALLFLNALAGRRTRRSVTAPDDDLGA